MRVAMIGLRGLSDGLGGIESALMALAPRLVERGIDVTCYCKAPYSSAENYRGVRLVNLPCFQSKLLETPTYALRGIREAANGDYDVIHLHALSCAALSGYVRRIAPRAKIVATIHGLDWQRAKWGWFARQLLKSGERAACRWAHALICVSFSLYTYFQMVYPGVRSIHIPNGIDIQNECPLHAPKGLTSRKYFLYMGRIVPEKGVHHLINAYRALETDFPLIIAGPIQHTGKYAQELIDQASGDPRIHFVGTITGTEKLRYLTHAYLFILPSEIEGLPVALLEAASHGACPVISEIPTALEVLGSGGTTRGFTFDLRDKTQLREILELSLLCPELVGRLGEAAATYVIDHYNWNTIAEQTMRVYKQLVEG